MSYRNAPNLTPKPNGYNKLNMIAILVVSLLGLKNVYALDVSSDSTITGQTIVDGIYISDGGITLTVNGGSNVSGNVGIDGSYGPTSNVNINVAGSGTIVKGNTRYGIWSEHTGQNINVYDSAYVYGAIDGIHQGWGSKREINVHDNAVVEGGQNGIWTGHSSPINITSGASILGANGIKLSNVAAPHVLVDNATINGTGDGTADGYGMISDNGINGGSLSIQNNAIVSGSNVGIQVIGGNSISIDVTGGSIVSGQHGGIASTGSNTSINVDGVNSTVSSTGNQSHAIYLGGAQPNLTISNGAQVVGDTALLLDTEATSAVINVTGATVAGRSNLLDIRASDSSTINFNRSMLSGALLNESAANQTVSMDNTVWEGNALSTGTGTLSLNLNNHSAWNMASDSTLSELTGDASSTLNLGGKSDGVTNILTVSQLSGDVGLAFNTDVAGGLGDRIVVTGTASGDHQITVADSGREPSGPSSLTLMNIAGGDASFYLTGGVVDLGVWEYGLSRSGYDVVLSTTGGGPVDVDPTLPVKPPVTSPQNPSAPLLPAPPRTTPSADAIISMASAPQYIYNGELSNLRYRKGDINADKGDNGGVWGRYLTNNTRIHGAADSAYSLQQDGFQLGGDKVINMAHGKLLVGAFVSYTNNNLKHARGGKSNIESSGGGVYATYFDPTGIYVDTVLKGNHFSNSMNAIMSNGGNINSSYSQNGFGGAVETGWNMNVEDIFWVEPYFRATGFHGSSQDITLNNGMTAKLGSVRSIQGEIGVNSGKNYIVGKMQVKPYLKAAIAHEFISNNNVQINDAYNFDNDYSGTIGRYGAGVDVVLSKNASVYAEADYQKGTNVETPVMANAGFRIKF